MEEVGQIRMGTPFGDKLYNLCLTNPHIQTVVEIGTWRGLGSTECLINGLKDSGKKELKFISIEAEANMYDIACKAWENKLPSWAKLLYGRIINVDELDNINLNNYHPNESLWFEQDYKALSECPNILNMIPEKIDFLFLDGGEFSTFAEYVKLKDRCLYIGLDDTTSRKCQQIRHEVLSNPKSYEILLDNPWYRNGIMIYKILR